MASGYRIGQHGSITWHPSENSAFSAAQLPAHILFIHSGHTIAPKPLPWKFWSYCWAWRQSGGLVAKSCPTLATPWTEEPGRFPVHGVPRVGHNLVTKPRYSILDVLWKDKGRHCIGKIDWGEGAISRTLRWLREVMVVVGKRMNKLCEGKENC